MRSIESMLFTDDELEQVAVDLHAIANTAWQADRDDSEESLKIDVNVRTAAYLNANESELGDDVAVVIDSRLNDDVWEAVHCVVVTPVSRQIGRSGVVEFMRTQAELAELAGGKDFTGNGTALRDAQMWLDYRIQQRDSHQEIARVACKELEDARDELKRRSQLEYAKKIVEAAESQSRLQAEFPGVSIRVMSDAELVRDREAALWRILRSQNPNKTARDSNHNFPNLPKDENISLLEFPKNSPNSY